jgi:1,2-diacylglycerol 3-alpha-glucosyltransferase
MRIAIFAESYLPYLSGVTISTDALARGLAAAGHEVLLIAPRPADPSTTASVSSAWLASYQLPRLVPRGYRMPWPLPSGALRRAEDFRPEVVHAQSPFVSGVMARRLARRLAAPLVFTHHTRFVDYRHYLGPAARPAAGLIDAYLRSYWAGCAAIICPSADLAAEIDSRLDPQRHRPLLRVVPTGIDVAAIRRLPRVNPRRLAGWPDDALVVASLGRLAPEKSIEQLVAAFERAARRVPRLRLLLIGGGSAEEWLRRRAGDRMHLTGVLPRLDALSLLKGADAFAFASRTETQGLVLAEALACGLPVVAVRGPAVAESVRDGIDGRIVAEAELADAMVDLAASGESRREMAAAAIAGADRFDTAHRIAQIESVYREV